MSTRDLQRRLAELGYEPGPVDGIHGQKTVEAIRRFQAQNELPVDGVAGPLTRAALLSDDAIPADAPGPPVDLRPTPPPGWRPEEGEPQPEAAPETGEDADAAPEQEPAPQPQLAPTAPVAPPPAEPVSMKAIQERLSVLGYDPGPIDGVRGRLTIAALKQFQTDRGVTADGMCGPATAEMLFASPCAPEEAQIIPWFGEASRLLGVCETPGARHNPVIMDWAQRLGLWYPDDETPWCGLFAAHCVAAALPDEPLPDNPLGARNWMKFGVPCEPQRGAVLVFWRGSRDGWQGHVGFYGGEDSRCYHVIGGNQSNKVCSTRLTRNRLLGARWPHSAGFVLTGRRQAGETGEISENEA